MTPPKPYVKCPKCGWMNQGECLTCKYGLAHSLAVIREQEMQQFKRLTARTWTEKLISALTGWL